MRITQTQRTASGAQARGVPAASSSTAKFQPSAATESRKTATARAPAAVNSLGAIIALQAVEDSTERRRKAVRQGSDVLDQLEEIKLELLSGQVPRARLARLRAIVQRYEEQDLEPGLADLLRQIDLRARVELAKHEDSAA